MRSANSDSMPDRKGRSPCKGQFLAHGVVLSGPDLVAVGAQLYAQQEVGELEEGGQHRDLGMTGETYGKDSWSDGNWSR